MSDNQQESRLNLTSDYAFGQTKRPERKEIHLNLIVTTEGEPAIVCGNVIGLDPSLENAVIKHPPTSYPDSMTWGGGKYVPYIEAAMRIGRIKPPICEAIRDHFALDPNATGDPLLVRREVGGREVSIPDPERPYYSMPDLAEVPELLTARLAETVRAADNSSRNPPGTRADLVTRLIDRLSAIEDPNERLVTATSYASIYDSGRTRRSSDTDGCLPSYFPSVGRRPPRPMTPAVHWPTLEKSFSGLLAARRLATFRLISDVGDESTARWPGSTAR